jgi:hypothetical protein
MRSNEQQYLIDDVRHYAGGRREFEFLSSSSNNGVLSNLLRPSSDGYDIGGPAPICWKTSNGETFRLTSCPGSLVINFLNVPPKTMFAKEDYTTTYRLTIDSTSLSLTKLNISGKSYDIPSALVRSCRNKIGFCTPFIENTRGLSYSSLPISGNLIPGDNNHSSAEFISTVNVDPGSYTNIAHLQFWGQEGGEAVKYDVAAAFVRDVLPSRKVLQPDLAVRHTMAVVVGLAGLFLAVTFICLVYWRKHKVLRFSQVNILMYMTLAGLIALCGVPLAAVNTQQACFARPWITIIPLNFMFGLLFGKTWRIYRLMNNKNLKAIKIKESYVLYVALLLTLPEVFIHGFYQIVFTPRLQLIQVINEYTFMYECTGGSLVKNVFDGLHLAYAAMILCLGCYVANKSASLTTLFNEGKHIMFAIYTCFVLSIIIVPASFAVATDPQTSFILRTLGVTLAVAGTIGGIIIPKIRLILSGVDLSLDDSKGNTTKAVSTHSETRATSSNAIKHASTASTCVTPSTIKVKDRVPTVVMQKLVDVFASGATVVDRQKQGYALRRSDWENCVEQIRGLDEILQRCVLSSEREKSADSRPGGSTAKVAPTLV